MGFGCGNDSSAPSGREPKWSIRDVLLSGAECLGLGLPASNQREEAATTGRAHQAWQCEVTLLM